jgi:NADH:ubiquinone oxidoreductase subunit 2 (subunit N)
MNKIISSASKIVFILIALSVIGAMFKGIISGEQFMVVAIGVFSFYFTKSVPTSGTSN